ncbi:TPA: hypothetical protein ACTGGM_002528, partial [Legionella pneumophila]
KHHTSEVHPGCFIISCSNPSKTLNLLKKALNNIPFFVDITIVVRWIQAVLFAWDNSSYPIIG